MPREPLALLLLRATRWFDAALLDALEAEGWPRLTPAQSLVFAQLDPDGVAPATLARRLGTSRQAASQLVEGLVRHELFVVVEDPARRAGRLVRLSERGQALATDAGRILGRLERQFGVERSRALRELLQEQDRSDPR